jgi:acetoin utilization deacetylase AcuC-like enzyme
MDEIVFYYPQGHQAHLEGGHPERPERVEALVEALKTAGWWDSYPHVEPQRVEYDFLARVHTEAYLENLQSRCRAGARLDMDTYTTPDSWELALNAVGGAIAVADSVWNGKSHRGFALTRPPGHHATVARGMGFCLLNNIALAAEYLLSAARADNGNAQRLAIIDLDLHHGNGTQDIFWERGDVLYISTHQYPHYPGTGNMNEIGIGAGEGTTVNFPLPPFSGDRCFRTVMETLILPLLDRFSPQMLLVSFGFDPHWRDPLGNLMLSAEGYGDLIGNLIDWSDQNCQGRIALFLEGGYDLDAGAACAHTVTAALLGEPRSDSLGPSPHPEAATWQPMIDSARQIWRV